MSRQMPCVTYNIPSNRAVKCLLECHKAVNRAHFGSNDGISFDATLPSRRNIEYDLLPPRTKIDATILDKNKVLSQGWGDRLFQHLQKCSFKINSPKEFEGIKYVLTIHIPREPIFSLNTIVMDLKNFTKKMKKESNQIPILAKGVVAMELNSPLNWHRFINYAKQLLRRGLSNNILAIIVWYEEFYHIMYRIASVNDELLEFLAMSFKVNDS
jgi:hypothetical protein